MRIQLEKFMAITALLASGAALGTGCTTEDTKTTTDAGVSGGGGVHTGGKGGTGGGVGGSTGGTAGSATGGTAGQATGGTAGQAAGGTAGAAGAGGTTCLGDGTPDAGTEGCASLPYGTATCPDAGTESGLPLGMDVCTYMAANGRPEVTAAMFSCLAAINVADPCSTEHDTAVQACINQIFPQACQKPPLDDGDGGTYDPCTDIVANCPTITAGECNNALNPVTDTAETTILTCYATPATTDCKADFETCVGLPQ